MPSHHRAQVLALLRDGVVHAPSEFELDRLEFGSQAFGAGQPQDHEVTLPCLPAAMREPQEVEGLRFALSLAASVVPGEAPELDQPRLVGVQLQPELAQPLGDRTLKRSASSLELEPGNPIVGIPHRDHVAPGMAPPPLLDPQVERVVQVDVGQERRDAAALHRTQFTLRQPAFFQHARVQPFLDQPHDARVSHAVLDELTSQSCSMVSKNLLMSASSIQLTLLRLNPTAHGIQRVVRALARPEAVAEPAEVLFVDRTKDFGRCALDDLVLQRWHGQSELHSPLTELRDGPRSDIPFHPLKGQRFQVLKQRRVAGIDTLILRDAARGSFAVPVQWTDRANARRMRAARWLRRGGLTWTRCATWSS